jgi:hypothetical protein
MKTSRAIGWDLATPTYVIPPAPAPARPAYSLLDKFAEQLSQHIDDDDVRAGIGIVANPGGNIGAASAAIRVSEDVGQGFFDRICRQLGDQAR